MVRVLLIGDNASLCLMVIRQCITGATHLKFPTKIIIQKYINIIDSFAQLQT